MTKIVRKPLVTRLFAAAMVVASIAWPADEVAAQGMFDFLFGARRVPSPSPSAVPQAPSPVVPLAAAPQPSSAGSPAVAFCVRLCDGRYFPMQHQRATQAAELCHAFCPASKTKIFSGSEIGRAVAADGTRYAGLTNAFVYRRRVVADCTCNGKDAFGLATLTIDADPTLRPGDVVATKTMAQPAAATVGRRQREVGPRRRMSLRLVLEGERYAGAKRGDFSVVHLHVHLGHFGHAQVAQ